LFSSRPEKVESPKLGASRPRETYTFPCARSNRLPVAAEPDYPPDGTFGLRSGGLPNTASRRKEGEMALKIGDVAPDFDLPTDGGGRVRLSDLAGKPVVVYFYPKDDTSGCTKEAQEFTALMPEFAARGVRVIGISPDGVAAHDRFRAKYDLAVTLAADPDKSVLEAWGVWVEKSMYGRSYMGVERTTVLVGADGKVAAVWPKVKVAGHAAAVLKALG